LSEAHLRGGPRCSNSLGRWPAIAIARRETIEDRGHLVLPTFGHTTALHSRPGGGDTATTLPTATSVITEPEHHGRMGFQQG